MFFVGLFILWSLFYFTGLVAYAAYADCDPLATKQIQKADQIVPFLVADKLKHLPGMAGLFVAAIYGGVLSFLTSQCICCFKFGKISYATGYGLGKTLVSLRQTLQDFFGAFVGFVTSFLFNVWLLIGQIVYETGKTANLPLSTSGCPEELLNLTLQSNNMNDTLILEDTTTYENLNFEAIDAGHLLMYDISYCYIGTIGILVVFIVSTLVSILTGVTKPEEVNPKLVYGPSLYVYKKLWKVWKVVKPSKNYMDCVTYTYIPSESIEQNEEKTLKC
ncbi:Sodium-coupled monocarboxylate transporter 1 [Armadillidium vulgare]|nr:Sodium-coupled monocarboxylate transporter 1 [Armadillidium vulgare]